ncbi:MAG: hypothetical protein ISS70_07030 [Phycisphaerae bacterium]|nr:hypothetical protein [Phycisphaerae bacterium]
MINLKTDIQNTFKYFEGSPVLRENDREYVLEGKLHCCVAGYEELYDIFNVAIAVPFIFPRQLPTVVEKDQRIQRKVEYHMDGKGRCCLGTETALYDYMQIHKITSFCQFLEQVVIMFFFQVKYFLANGHWIETPEAHYTQGRIDSYKRIFGLSEGDLKKIVSMKFKRYAKCLCNSNRRFDKCHGKYIPLEQIQKDFKEMGKHWK